jgi:hypothetical protein
MIAVTRPGVIAEPRVELAEVPVALFVHQL